MRLPNFLVLGAQRSGSTWLYQSLRRHPEVYMPEKKELEFFSYPERKETLGLEGYSREHFSGVRKEKAIGEASPSYLWVSNEYPKWRRKPPGFAENLPKDVYDTLGPDTKLIVSLRNPVQRAISGYIHHLNQGRLNHTKSVLDAGRFGGIVHIGFYYAHLMEWLRYFDRSNIFILIFEEATRCEQESFNELFRFLGVNPEKTNPAMTRQFNKNRDVVDIGGAKFVSRSGSPIAPGVDKNDSDLAQIASADELEQLQDIYTEDVRKLSEFLEKDLESLWFGN